MDAYGYVHVEPNGYGGSGGGSTPVSPQKSTPDNSSQQDNSSPYELKIDRDEQAKAAEAERLSLSRLIQPVGLSNLTYAQPELQATSVINIGAQNNPLRYVDPSGHLPSSNGIIDWLKQGLSCWYLVVNPPGITASRADMPPTSDLTAWLVDQMVNNAQSEVVSSIKAHWETEHPAHMGGALATWNALVQNEAVWDFKEDIRMAGYPEFPAVTLGGESLRFDAVANIHYGFVGRAAGLPSWLLQSGGGIAQWRAWHETKPDNVGPVDTYLDDPYDNWNVLFGICLYDQYRNTLDVLTPEAFNQALDDFIGLYGTPESWEDDSWKDATVF